MCLFKCCRNSPSTENGFAYGHALIYKMSPVVHHPGEEDDILNIPIQVLHRDIKLQLLARLLWYPLMYYHAIWQHTSPSLNSFRSLWASTRNHSVYDCEDKSNKSPWVSVAVLAIGTEGNLNPCTEFQRYGYSEGECQVKNYPP